MRLLLELINLASISLIFLNAPVVVASADTGWHEFAFVTPYYGSGAVQCPDHTTLVTDKKPDFNSVADSSIVLSPAASSTPVSSPISLSSLTLSKHQPMESQSSLDPLTEKTSTITMHSIATVTKTTKFSNTAFTVLQSEAPDTSNARPNLISNAKTETTSSAAVFHSRSNATISSLGVAPFVNHTASTPSAPVLTNLTIKTVTSLESISSAHVSPSPVIVTTSALSTTVASSHTASIPQPHYKGFNVVNQSPTDPSKFKGQDEWASAFIHIKALPGDFNAVRLYSTTDSGIKHLPIAIPAARDHNLSVHVGVWSGGDAHIERFNIEKVALDEALAQLGCANIVAVSVGNEDMYNARRSQDDPDRSPLKDIMLLVNQTQEIIGILDKHRCCDVKVTHTDTFGAWLMTNVSEPLIQQVDFLTVNIFPYWSSQNIDSAGAMFWNNLNQTREMAAYYGKEVWIGETGWPRTGKQVGSAFPSPDNMRKYWDQIGCKLMDSMNAFWYAEWDSNQYPSFGLMDKDGESVIGNISCSLMGNQAS